MGSKSFILVDDTPTVGTAITWDTNGPEHSSMGHVAYVEKVMNDGTIIISQYNNGGDGTFSFSGITKADLQKQKNQIKFIYFDKLAEPDKHSDERDRLCQLTRNKCSSNDLGPLLLPLQMSPKIPVTPHQTPQ